MQAEKLRAQMSDVFGSMDLVTPKIMGDIDSADISPSVDVGSKHICPVRVEDTKFRNTIIVEPSPTTGPSNSKVGVAPSDTSTECVRDSTMVHQPPEENGKPQGVVESLSQDRSALAEPHHDSTGVIEQTYRPPPDKYCVGGITIRADGSVDYRKQEADGQEVFPEGTASSNGILDTGRAELGRDMDAIPQLYSEDGRHKVIQIDDPYPPNADETSMIFNG